MVDSSGPKKIDCGLKEIDAKKYKRNYVVHENSKDSVHENSLQFNWSTSKVVFQYSFTKTIDLNMKGHLRVLLIHLGNVSSFHFIVYLTFIIRD